MCCWGNGWAKRRYKLPAFGTESNLGLFVCYCRLLRGPQQHGLPRWNIEVAFLGIYCLDRLCRGFGGCSASESSMYGL